MDMFDQLLSVVPISVIFLFLNIVWSDTESNF